MLLFPPDCPSAPHHQAEGNTRLTPDSDNFTDWFVPDENSRACLKRFTPPHAEAPVVQMIASLSSATTLKESPTTLFPSGAFWRTKRRSVCSSWDDGDYCVSPANSAIPQETPMVFSVKGDSPGCKQGPSCVSPKCLSIRKRTLDGHGAHPQPDTRSELFSLKCTELQCYVQPLSSILRGLRSGRYSARLSSFQESVAMDRIQRIMGVLQNPNLGGHFLCIIVKIEEMLRSWFPRIRPNQTHDSPPAKKQKAHSSAAWSPASVCSSDGALVTSDSLNYIRRLHTSPVCSLEQSQSTLGPQSPSQVVTQDNFVSSTTDCLPSPPRHTRGHQRPLPRGPLLFKISSPCLERLLKSSLPEEMTRRPVAMDTCMTRTRDALQCDILKQL
ncbi:uncharacterized protein LOC127599765 isoform X2 [Hippocampus zosterae]|uniref:uncharacterized protein LOC127599765 isoform X2 n=1 Tax=Hippocampus zosterae TaxID=109293 RepID=UPI00223DF95D|nr:uncharacterized protein LOC127599765 isoform X2 [Hippocampus zosterae]